MGDLKILTIIQIILLLALLFLETFKYFTRRKKVGVQPEEVKEENPVEVKILDPEPAPTPKRKFERSPAPEPEFTKEYTKEELEAMSENQLIRLRLRKSSDPTKAREKCIHDILSLQEKQKGDSL